MSNKLCLHTENTRYNFVMTEHNITESETALLRSMMCAATHNNADCSPIFTRVYPRTRSFISERATVQRYLRSRTTTLDVAVRVTVRS